MHALFFYKKTIVYLWTRFTIGRAVFLFSLVYERALRGCLNNRNSVHFQPEVHGFFSTLKKHNKNYAFKDWLIY